MNKEYTKNLTLPWANICKVILYKIKLTGEILLGALLKCRQFKKWLRKILDNYQNVDILETCLDSPKFC